MEKVQITGDITTNNKLATQVPQAMLNLNVLTPNREPLTVEQTLNAIPCLVNKDYIQLNFPKTQRIRVDPVLENQKIGVITFVPSKTAIPDKDGVFGVLKVRGTFEDEDKADIFSEDIIRNVDSYNENYYVYVGRDFPICVDNDKFCKATKEVDIRSKLDGIAKEKIIEERKKEEIEKREVQQRHQQLLTDVKIEKSFDDLDFYVSLRVKLAQARMMQEEYEQKLKQLSKTIKTTKEKIYELDEKFPEYIKQYEAKYNSAVDAIGGDHNNKMLQYMK
jgi:hypothetical protein